MTLGGGINLIVGANNVGKSALIRALELPLVDDRHRRPGALEHHRLGAPHVLLDIRVNGAEIKNAMLEVGGSWAVGIRPGSERFDFDKEFF
jgi:recombinational DNA repair ATPase RecF